MAQASQSVVNVHDGVNERIQKCENPHSRNASNRHRPQTDDWTGMMESLQETGWLALEQQNDRVKQLVVLANVE